MHWIDWMVVAAYVGTAIGIGVYFTKRAANSTTDFFVAGRTLPWWVAGTSIVATTFSADTPLFVAGLSRTTGVHGNWFWWSAAIGCVATVFFFARLWRRTEALTDIEFVVQRYAPGPSRDVLRIFKVFYDGVFVNCVVMASVTLAMAKIAKVVLGLSDSVLLTVPVFGPVTPTGVVLTILGATALLYSVLSGLYGVVYTDLVQFALAMIGCIGLAAIVYVDASGGEGLMARLAAAPDFKASLLGFVPDLSTFSLPLFAFLVYIFIGWWGGAPGSGFYVQRLLACKSEKDSVLAFLLFSFLHFVVRSWPWVIVGILSIIYFPGLEDAESSFPLMIDRFLPVGLKGVMVAAMLAAFMSTLDTQLNWGASYLVNDFYQPYIARKHQKTDHAYVNVSRFGMVLLMLAALLVSTRLTTILDAYKYLGLMWGGIGTVMIMRWYWWRVNAWSEISAIVASLVIGNVAAILLPNVETPVAKDYYAVRLIITITGTALVWIVVTLLTSHRVGTAHKTFYRKMRIPGPGWARVAAETGIAPLRGELRTSVLAWLSCTLLLLAVLLGIGKFIFHEWVAGLAYAVIAIVSARVLRAQMSKITFLD